MQIEPSIFKAYDIRGTYPDQINEAGARAIGRAVATLFLKESGSKPVTVAVGGDMRLSTPVLKEQLIAGLLESGISVVDIGLVSTPTYYYAVAKFGYDGGVQVSASHNPKDYNGFKIVRHGGVAMSGETGIQELREIIESESFVSLAEMPGKLTTRGDVTASAIDEYVAAAGSRSSKPYKVVIDTANAVGALDYEALFAKLSCEIVWMNKQLDGTFPGHEADPLKPENTEAIRNKVLEVDADFGIAADGDADRVFIINEKGQTVPSPILYALIAKELLAEYPTETFAYEIRLGKIIHDIFDGTSAKLVPTPVGHSLEKKIMIDSNALFGGEISGHYFFRLPFGTFEAPVYLVLKLLQLMEREQKQLSELQKPFEKYVSSGEINTKVESREQIETLLVSLREKYQDGVQVTIDGLKVEYANWWFSVRASNTEPLVRLIVEANTIDLMETKRDELLTLIRL